MPAASAVRRRWAPGGTRPGGGRAVGDDEDSGPGAERARRERDGDGNRNRWRKRNRERPAAGRPAPATGRLAAAKPRRPRRARDLRRGAALLTRMPHRRIAVIPAKPERCRERRAAGRKSRRTPQFTAEDHRSRDSFRAAGRAGKRGPDVIQAKTGSPHWSRVSTAMGREMTYLPPIARRRRSVTNWYPCAPLPHRPVSSVADPRRVPGAARAGPGVRRADRLTPLRTGGSRGR